MPFFSVLASDASHVLFILLHNYCWFLHFTCIFLDFDLHFTTFTNACVHIRVFPASKMSLSAFSHPVDLQNLSSQVYKLPLMDSGRSRLASNSCHAVFFQTFQCAVHYAFSDVRCSSASKDFSFSNIDTHNKKFMIFFFLHRKIRSYIRLFRIRCIFLTVECCSLVQYSPFYRSQRRADTKAVHHFHQQPSRYLRPLVPPSFGIIVTSFLLRD